MKHLIASLCAVACVAAFAVPVRADKTIDTDVVIIIGAGAAGFAAAELGAKVVMLEKQPNGGGTAQFSEGIFAVESSMQWAINYALTKDEVLRLIMNYSHWRANAKLVRAFIEKDASSSVKGAGSSLLKSLTFSPDSIISACSRPDCAGAADRFYEAGGQRPTARCALGRRRCLPRYLSAPGGERRKGKSECSMACLKSCLASSTG